MYKLKDLPREKDTNGKLRTMALFACKECNVQKKRRSDYKSKTGLCRSCANKTHGDTGTRLYNIYYNMLARCYNPKNNRYDYYGAKGISVSPEWDTYDKFKSWAFSTGYCNTLTLDRIDTKDDYKPTNCRWATYNQQAVNRSYPKGKSGFAGVTSRHIAQIKYKGKCLFYKETDTALEASVLREIFILEHNLEHQLNFPFLSKKYLQELVKSNPDWSLLTQLPHEASIEDIKSIRNEFEHPYDSN